MAQDKKAGGHGLHWQFVLQQAGDDERLRQIMEQTVRTTEPDIVGNLAFFVMPESGVQAGVLLENSAAGGWEVISAYPYVEGGQRWQIRVEEVVEWANGAEAQITGTTGEAQVSLFDLLYYNNRGQYEPGETLPFVVNGLAYRVDAPVYDSEEQERLFSQFKGFLPVEGADIDDFQFISSVEAIRFMQCLDVDFTVYTIPLAILESGPLLLDLYTPQTAQQRVFQIGEQISGRFWLFGYPVD